MPNIVFLQTSFVGCTEYTGLESFATPFIVEIYLSKTPSWLSCYYAIVVTKAERTSQRTRLAHNHRASSINTVLFVMTTAVE